VTSGVKMYSFEGHDAPVYSLCPHSKGNVHVRITLDSTLTRGGDIDSSPCLLKLMMTPSLLLLFIFFNSSVSLCNISEQQHKSVPI